MSSLYQECFEIWAGCPAATSIDGGFETTGVNNPANEEEILAEENSSIELDSQGSSIAGNNEENIDYIDEDSPVSCEPLKKKMKLRREELANLLKDGQIPSLSRRQLSKRRFQILQQKRLR